MHEKSAIINLFFIATIKKSIDRMENVAEASLNEVLLKGIENALSNKH